MTVLTNATPFGGLHSLRRFSVAEYHRMIQAGILTDEDRVELLDGYVVLKRARNPPHDGTIQLIQSWLSQVLPADWDARIQCAVTLSASEPEPDFAVVRDGARRYLSRHPNPADVGLIIEVANTTLHRDRDEKAPLYAQDGIAIYWIVNLLDHRIEVRTAPAVVGGQPAYTQQQDFAPGDLVPLILDGVTVATIDARELLP